MNRILSIVQDGSRTDIVILWTSVPYDFMLLTLRSARIFIISDLINARSTHTNQSKKRMFHEWLP